MPKATNARTYSALAQVSALHTSGRLRGDLTARDLRRAVRALAGLNLVLFQHLNSLGDQSDALEMGVDLAKGIVEDLEVDPK